MADLHAMSELPQTLEFHQIKSADYRPHHVDGCLGSVTPSGHIHMVVYTEHTAIPQRLVHRVTPDGKLGEEVESERIGKDGIVRDITAALVMTLPTAKRIHQWLGERVEDLTKVFQEAKAQAQDAKAQDK